MESKIFNLIAYISDEDEICFCEKDNFKTCVERIKNNLPCAEMIVRFTPVVREDTGTVADIIKTEEDLLKDVNSTLKKTLDHLRRIRT